MGYSTNCLFLSGGNLNNGDNAGSANLNLNNGLSNTNWNIASLDYICHTQNQMILKESDIVVKTTTSLYPGQALVAKIYY